MYESAISLLQHECLNTIILLQKNKWRDLSYESRTNNEELQAKCNEFQAQINREKEISDAFQKEIESLQQAFAEHIEESRGDHANSTRSEDMVRYLKRQLDDRDLLVERLREEVKVAEKARDEAFIAKQEFIALHHAEHSVSCWPLCGLVHLVTKSHALSFIV